jgi:hypothetical protein
MPKIPAFLLALALAFPLQAARQQSASDRMMKVSSEKPKSYDRQALALQIDETLGFLEDLSRQLALAPKSEADEVWKSGERDFQLHDTQVSDSRKACELLMKAQALEDQGKAEEAQEASLREKVRDLMRKHHKKQTEAYVRDMRNWLTVSEGELRRANEKRAAKP